MGIPNLDRRLVKVSAINKHVLKRSCEWAIELELVGKGGAMNVVHEGVEHLAVGTRLVKAALFAAGSAHAGHRPVWDDVDVRDGITLDFFMVIDDLSARHGGNAAGAADGVRGGAAVG